MKYILAIFAVTLLSITGALANHPSVPTGSTEQLVQPSRSSGNLSIRGESLRRSSRNPHDVYVGGEYAGTDPDPFIRSSLAREHGGRPTE